MIPYSVNVIWSEEDEAYLATIPELPGLTAFGDTQLEALQEATEIAEDMIAIKIKYNEPIPKPLVKNRDKLQKSVEGEDRQVNQYDI